MEAEKLHDCCSDSCKCKTKKVGDAVLSESEALRAKGLGQKAVDLRLRIYSLGTRCTNV